MEKNKTSTPKLSFCYDRLQSNGEGYPNLAEWGLTWKNWDFVWPKTIRMRLLKFLTDNHYEYQETTVEGRDSRSFYPIGISWFDFECDYIGLIPEKTRHLVQSSKIKILFYYHEGDNPHRIKHRIDLLCVEHNLPNDCYIFISANTAANNIENFIYFNDHESFFANINRFQSSNVATITERPREFTLLTRTHKWWRATCTLDLHRQALLSNSIWSYHSDCDIGEKFSDNPIDLSRLGIPKAELRKFVSDGPYTFDENALSHNDHRKVNLELFNNSYIHLVLETHFDADQSSGTFLTEKTFKPIKYGQPFVLIAPAHSLKLLRSLGYRTFDNVIDTSYDSIEDNTTRWIAARDSVIKLKQTGIKKIFNECYPDIVYNQYHFTERIRENLNHILKRIADELNC